MDFLSHFHYNKNAFMSMSIGTFDNATFVDGTNNFDIPINTDVWFSPALRGTKGHEKKNVLGTKVLWVDVDDTRNIPRPTLPPSILVDSGGGYHAYYILKEPCEDIEAIEEANKLLASDFPNGDPSCWNVNRIMRVPGTLNCKPEYGDPRRVSILLEDTSITYSMEDIQSLSKINPKTRHKIRTGDQRGYRTRSERDWAVLKSLVRADISDELISLLFAHQPCGDKARSEPTYFTHSLARAREATKNEPKGKAQEKQQVVVAESADGLYLKGKRITTFTLDPVLLLDGNQYDVEDAIVCNVSAEGHVWNDITFPKSAFNSVPRMDSCTKIAAWQFLGTESGLRAILPYLMELLQAKGLPRVVATPILGLHRIKDKWLFLGDKQTMSEDEIWNGFDGPLAWLPSNKEHPELDFSNEPDVPHFQRLMQIVSKLNDPETIWPIIGWYTMSHLKPAIEECNYRFPILNITGTRGSGKTTLVLRVFMKMFGQYEPKSYDAGTTRFVTLALLGSSNAVPIAFSEFRMDSVSSFIRYILLAYDTGHDPRGKADQSTVDYPLSAPFSIDGEDLVNDPAAQERIVVALLHPKAIEQGTEAYAQLKVFMEKFQTTPGAWIIQNLMAEIPSLSKSLEISFRELMQEFPSSMPDRIRRNYTIAWTGIKLWCKMAEMDPPDISVLNESIQILYNTKIGRSRVAADGMIEDLANAASGGAEFFKYKVINQTDFWFQLASGHNFWMASKRRQGRGVLDRDAIRTQLKEAPYFLGAQAIDGVWMFGISLTKAFELGLDLPSSMDVGVVTFHVKSQD